MTLASGTRLGPYEVQSPLGAGGMGEVYRARDTKLGRDVALKILPELFASDPERLARFEREAKTLAALNHTHIAQIYGFEQSGVTSALVMELVEGEDLAQRLVRGPIPLDEALAITKQIAEALEAAHEQGIVHRDLKPANIKLRPDGTVKVLDFGLAKAVDPVAQGFSPANAANSPTFTVAATQLGVIVGTAAYMAPEQARGKAVDKRADIWAFGCVLYEMLTGQQAFSGDTVTDLLAAVVQRDPDWTRLPPDTPRSVHRLIRRCLQKDPSQRLRDIGDARVELADPLFDEPPDRDAAGARRPAWRGAAVAALAIVLAAGIAAWSILQSRSTALPPSVTQHVTVSQLTSLDGTESDGAISPDGRSFVFVSDHGGTPDLWLRKVGGGEPVRLTNDPAVESAPIYSPDGELVYFGRTDGGPSSIWSIGALGGHPRKIVDGGRAPGPSPDGRSLAWFAPAAAGGAVSTVPTQGPLGGTGLFVGGVDGSNPRLLVAGIVPQPAYNQTHRGTSRPGWSSDARSLAYSTGGLWEPRNLFVVDAAGGSPRQVTQFTRSVEGVQTQAWLPDNRHLVVSYVAWPHSPFASDLGVVDRASGAIVRLTMNVADSLEAPSVSTDGTRIVMTSSQVDSELWRVPFGPDPVANGRAAVRIMDASRRPTYTHVPHGGRTLLFTSTLVGSRNLFTMPLDGSGAPRQITAIPGDAVVHCSLSPDGARVAFISFITGNPDVWVQNVDGSALRQLTNDPNAEAWPVWSPDGRSIVYSKGDGTWRIPAAGGAAEKLFDGGFRGDWIAKPDGSGTLIVTTGPKLLDVERRRVVWEDRAAIGGLPMFSSDARLVSTPCPDARDRDAICVYDVATGASRVAVRFPEPFEIRYFRANWADGNRAFIVARGRAASHIVMFDRLGLTRTR